MGTPAYAAPEIHLRRPYLGEYSDIFSLGITEKDLIILVVAAFVVFLISMIQEKSIIGCRVLIDSKPVVLEVFLIVVLLTIVLMFGIYGPTYNASDFVYAQF